MASTKIAPGNIIETITEPELRHHLNNTIADWFQEKARGVATYRANATATPAAGTITIPSIGADNLGPQQGFVWLVQSIRIYGLASGDTVNIFRNFATPQNFVGTLSATTPTAKFGSKSLILKADEKLIITGTITATADITINTEGIECGEPDLYKVL